MGKGRSEDISALGIAAGTWPARRVGSSDGARRNPTCGGAGSRSGTSSGRQLPFGLKKRFPIMNEFIVISAKIICKLDFVFWKCLRDYLIWNCRGRFILWRSIRATDARSDL